MARRVTATFADPTDAERAQAGLVQLGADASRISVLARQAEPVAAGERGAGEPRATGMVEPARQVGDEGAPLTTADSQDAVGGAETGAAVGAVAGIAAGLLSLLVPGVGLVTAGGALAWALGGAAATTAAGAIVGGAIGGLHDLGIEGAHAATYEERLRQGDSLLIAHAPPVDDTQTEAVLREYNGEHIRFTEV